jgi:hypothetical protein
VVSKKDSNLDSNHAAKRCPATSAAERQNRGRRTFIGIKINTAYAWQRRGRKSGAAISAEKHLRIISVKFIFQVLASSENDYMVVPDGKKTAI